MKPRLGEILLSNGSITRDQLQRGLAEQARVKQPLGQVLFRLRYITDETLRRALAGQLSVPFIDLDRMTLDRALAKVIPREYARQRLVVPVSRLGQSLTVAMDDPTAQNTIDELHQLTRYSIAVVTATGPSIREALRQLYESDPAIVAAGSDAGSPGMTRTAGRPAAVVVSTDEHAAGGRADELLNEILTRAFGQTCSDVHMELLSTGFHIRYRIDGVLREPNFGELQKAIDAASREIISRVKILARLDIAERRRPQDGSFRVTIERQQAKTHVDLRVSVVPSYSGESIVIRILDRARAPKSLAELDLSPAVCKALTALLQHTTGILLVTGPTGSGKSTTVSACLSMLHRPEIRVLTAEDPVEFVYDGISQSEVNEAIGNTFAAYLRAFLRHDPEVIVVGEIRDRETAEMAFRAAQTGHLLLSTMHTNSAIAALPRLLDLQIEPSLIGSSLIGVLSQRLARKVCPKCRRPDTPSPELVAAFFDTVPPDFTFYRGTGCAACGQTGYAGRMMVADLWVPDQQDLMLIACGAPFGDIRKSAARTSISMAQDAHQRLRAGQTTLEELMRVMTHATIADHRARVWESPAI